MIKAFRISFSLQNTYRVNSIIYSLKQIPLLVMTLPGLAYLFINNYIPIGGLFIAFKNIDYSKVQANGEVLNQLKLQMQKNGEWYCYKNFL